jgi:hypothetical protein
MPACRYVSGRASESHYSASEHSARLKDSYLVAHVAGIGV